MSNPNLPETISFASIEPSRTVWVVGRKETAAATPILRLVLLPGRQAFEIRQAEVIVGRHADVDLQLLQPDVSRRHCRLFCTDTQWHAEDLDSLNGTLVNGEHIQQVALHPNDVIRIGGQLFQIEIETAAAPIPDVGDAERSRNVLRSIAARLPEEDSRQRRRKSA